MQYKKNPKPIPEVSRVLNVGIVLEGSVRKAGDRLRITVQMIDAARDKHIWAESYDRDIDDVFAIQCDIAKQVAGALQVKLLPAERARLEKPPTNSVEAYELLLRGKSHRVNPSSASLKRAVECYEQAILEDPDFALAHAWMSFDIAQQGYYGFLPSTEAGPKAKECARKALGIDDSLAEAHMAFGFILHNYDWDFIAAEAEYERTVALNPSLAFAYGCSAYLKLCNRRFEEAISEVKRALALDPFSSEINHWAGTIFLYSGLSDEAIAQYTRALVINPSDWFSRDNLGLCYIRKGEVERGVQEVEKSGASADLAYAYSRARRVEDLKKLLGRLLEGQREDPTSSMAVASAYVGLGDNQKAIDWLEKAFSDHVMYLSALNCDFCYDPLRSEPRFKALLKKIGFTNYA
jgi:tetratricopeptide (TPR) repeat protein